MSEGLFSNLALQNGYGLLPGTVSVISSDPPGHHSMMAMPIYNGTLKVFFLIKYKLEFYVYNFAYLSVLNVVYQQKWLLSSTYLMLETPLSELITLNPEKWQYHPHEGITFYFYFLIKIKDVLKNYRVINCSKISLNHAAWSLSGFTIWKTIILKYGFLSKCLAYLWRRNWEERRYLPYCKSGKGERFPIQSSI